MIIKNTCIYHSAGTTIELPLFDSVNVFVDWGDGTIDTLITEGNHSHTYASNGTYKVEILGNLEHFEDVCIPCVGAQAIKSWIYSWT